MSERGSFVTEYIYCSKCFEVAKDILLKDVYIQNAIVIPQLSPGGLSSVTGNNIELPIIAGKAKGLYGGEELHKFEFDIIPELENRICHKMRIAVLAEDGEKIFIIKPVGYNCKNTSLVALIKKHFVLNILKNK